MLCVIHRKVLIRKQSYLHQLFLFICAAYFLFILDDIIHRVPVMNCACEHFTQVISADIT